MLIFLVEATQMLDSNETSKVEKMKKKKKKTIGYEKTQKKKKQSRQSPSRHPLPPVLSGRVLVHSNNGHTWCTGARAFVRLHVPVKLGGYPTGPQFQSKLLGTQAWLGHVRLSLQGFYHHYIRTQTDKRMQHCSWSDQNGVR
jgi:hypothetical protein